MTTQPSPCWRRLVPALCLPILAVGLLGADCRPTKTQTKQQRSTGVEPGSTKSSSADRELAVATIGNDKITVGMVEEELNRQNPYLRMRFASPERRKEFLKNLVRFEVLAQEAKNRGLATDPEVVRRVKRAMIDRMMEDLHTSLVKMESITDKDLEDYYKANLSAYQQPAKMRASWILVATKAEAEKVLAEAKSKPTDVAHFGELATKYSTDPASKQKRGDLDFFTQDTKDVPKAVVEATFASKGLWKLTGPYKTEKGYAVVMKTGELEAQNRTLEQEKDRIKNRVFNERRLKAMEKFMEDLQAKAHVVIDDKALAKVKVDLSMQAPQGLPGLHGHGGMPGMPGGRGMPGHLHGPGPH